MMRATSRSAWPAKTDARNFVCFRGAIDPVSRRRCTPVNPRAANLVLGRDTVRLHPGIPGPQHAFAQIQRIRRTAWT
jgi:hypothetical protein